MLHAAALCQYAQLLRTLPHLPPPPTPRAQLLASGALRTLASKADAAIQEVCLTRETCASMPSTCSSCLHGLPAPWPGGSGRPRPRTPCTAHPSAGSTNKPNQSNDPRTPACTLQRLEGYPGRALASAHHTSRAVLPLRLAGVLRADAQLVAAAVEAFYYRWEVFCECLQWLGIVWLAGAGGKAWQWP